jgi:hypothetical protein
LVAVVGGGGGGLLTGFGREGKRFAAEDMEDLKASAERWSDIVKGALTCGMVLRVMRWWMAVL